MSTNPLPGPQGPRPAAPLAKPLGTGGMPAQAGPAGMPPPGTQPGMQGPPQAPPGEEDDGPAPAISTNFLLFNAMPSWAVSGVVHFIGVIILALINVTPPPQSQQISTVSPPTEKEEEVEEFKEEKMEINVTETTVAATSSDVVAALTSDVVETTDTPSVAMDVDAAPVHIELSDFGEQTAPKNDLMAQVGAVTGTGVAGRGEAQRGQMVAKYGGNEASEAAVAAALKWFAAHQDPNDGSWNFDHRLGPCNGRCGDGGRMTDCKTGATAMAL